MAAWIGLALIVIILAVGNKLIKRYGKLGQIEGRLKLLAAKQQEGRSVPEDLPDWEDCLLKLEAYPSDANRLNQELRFMEVFAGFLAEHAPQDPRLPGLRAAGGYRKDTIWGIKISRPDSKE